jgi:anti-anti-sigma factor
MGDAARLLSTVADPHSQGTRSVSLLDVQVLPAPRHQRDGDAGVVKLVGELCAYTARQAEPALLSFIDYAGHVVIDLSELTFIDAAGVRLLHRLTTGTQAVSLDNVGPRVARTFELAGFDSLLPPSLEV